MIDSDKINEIILRIASRFNPEKIILFGSYAVGTQNSESDLDLLIVQETELPVQKRGFDIRMALLGIKIPVDLFIYTKSEFDQEKNRKLSFLNSAIKSGKVLYERVD